MYTPLSTATRLVAVAASVAVTGVLVASQFGLAHRYDDETRLLLVRQAVQQPLAQASAATASPRNPA